MKSDGVKKELERILGGFEAQLGTIHRFDNKTQHLEMVAYSGPIPPEVLAKTQSIPMGKGIAGQAALTRQPVTICNLQTSAPQVIPAGAKKSGASGSLCVPIFQGEQVVGTLGIGYFKEKEFSSEEVERLIGEGRSLVTLLAQV